MKLYHIADLHLGRRRLDGKLPDQDFADAFGWIVQQAVAEKPDAFLIAGDLFDSPHIHPHHLRQAQQCLRPLKQADIPVLAIEGNHDLVSLHATEASWLQYLSDEGLLHLLKIPFTADGPVITPWDDARRAGAYLELGGVRFVGAGYLGAGTPRRLRAITEKLDAAFPTVLLLHAGPDYFVGEGGGLGKEDLEMLRRKVVYLALGHIHKPMVHGDWACNPGAPENCDLSESAYDRRPDGSPQARGYAQVTLTPGQPPAIELRSNPRRPCLRLKLDCTPYGNEPGLEGLKAAALNLIRQQQAPAGGAVEISLTGDLNVSRTGFDPETMSATLEQATDMAAVALICSGINLPEGAAVSGADEGISREQLERQSIHTLIQEANLWGLADCDQVFADLFYSLKQDVQNNRNPEMIAERILSHALVDQVAAVIKATEAASQEAA